MCGLLAVFDPSKITSDQMDRASQSLSHRGTIAAGGDYDGVWIHHVRLPINGLNLFTYPLYDENTSIWLVGELYDWDSKNMTTDAELLRKIGPNTLYNGMYHFLIHNQVTNTWHIGMDEMGKKPLYLRPDCMAFSSEIKALTHLGKNTVNRDYMETIRAFPDQIMYELPPHHTPYNEIIKCPPGFKFQWREGKWSSSLNLDYHFEWDTSNLIMMLDRAVRKRATCDAPAVTLISGGLDSSIIWGMLHPSIPAIHIENQESEFAELVVSEDSEFRIDLQYPPAPDLEKILYYNETPLDLGSMVPQYLLGQAIKERGLGPVVITGDGADELFSGYRRAQETDTWDYDMTELRQWHLPKLDKLMMAHTLELRSPFLDPHVAHFAQELEYEERVGKQSLKAVAKGIGVPQQIIDREKRPLKSPWALEDKAEWNRKLVGIFLNNFAGGLHG